MFNDLATYGTLDQSKLNKLQQRLQKYAWDKYRLQVSVDLCQDEKGRIGVAIRPKGNIFNIEDFKNDIMSAIQLYNQQRGL